MFRRTLVLLGALTLTFTAGACGSDDDESSAGAEATDAVEGSGDADGDLDSVDAGAGGDDAGRTFADPPAAASYCERKAGQQPGTTAEAGLAHWKALQEVAPNEIRDDIAVVVDIHREAVAEGDPGAEVDTQAPSYTAALQNIVGFDVVNCPS